MMDINMDSSARIDLRTSEERKKILKAAAKVSGLSMTDFILTVSVEKAQERLKELTSMTVNIDDFNQMMSAFDNPPKPTAHLKKSMRKLSHPGASFEL